MQFYPFNKEALEGYRKAAKATQEEMAEHMRMPLRTYEDIAAGRVALRNVHVRAAEGALLFMARKRNDVSFLPEHLKELIRDLNGLLNKKLA